MVCRRAALIDTDDRNAKIARDLTGISADRGPRGEQAVLATAVARRNRARRTRSPPGRSAAIAVPDIAINHVGTDGQADPTPGGGDDQRGSPGQEAQPLPEDQVPLTIDLDRAVRRKRAKAS